MQQLIQHLLVTRQWAAGTCLMTRERCGGEGRSARGKNILSSQFQPSAIPASGYSHPAPTCPQDADNAHRGAHTSDVHLSPPLKLDVNWQQVPNLGGEFPQQQIPMS